MSSRAFGLRAALCAVLLLLAGCAGVPDSGPPQTVRQVPAGAFEDEPGVRAQPRAPNQGDTPEQIVRGFLAAGKSPADEHAIAREYLTSAASSRWQDTAGTRVIDVDQVTAEEATGNTTHATVTGRYRGRIEADASYTVDGRSLDFTFKLVKVAGEWRIDNPPQGLLLPQSDFAQVYRGVDLYFLDPIGHTVIPDRRYLDVKQAALPTAMVTLLLNGPSAWLAPGVQTAFPKGTQLRSNVVSDGDVLVVDLTQQAESATPTQRQAMAAQLSWTLRGFGVKAVRFLVEGRPFRVQGNDALVGRDDYVSYDPDRMSDDAGGYYLAGGVLRTAGGTPVLGPGGKPVTGLVSAAISADLGQLAGVRNGPGGRQELFLGPIGGPLPVVHTADAISMPSWGGGSTTAYVVADHRRLLRVATTGQVTPVSAPGLSAYGPVQSVRVGRAGVRVALVTGSKAQSRVVVGVLHRNGGSWQLTGLRAIAGDLIDIRDVSWLDSGSIVVLGRQPRAATIPWEVGVDGAAEKPDTVAGLPASPASVATAPGLPDLVEAGGRIWRRAGSSWTSPAAATAPTGRAPFYPG